MNILKKLFSSQKIEIIFIGGATRSGKSSLSKNLTKFFNLPSYCLINCDHYFDLKKLSQNYVNNILSLIESNEFMNYLNLNGTENDKQEIENLKKNLNFITIPNFLYNYMKQYKPLLLHQNWELDEVIDWNSLENDINESISKIKNNNNKYLIVEGFRLLQERYPFKTIFPDKIIFLCIGKELAKKRRELTKPMSPGQFDEYAWPEYLNAHKYLIKLFESGNNKNILVLDAESDKNFIFEKSKEYILNKDFKLNNDESLKIIKKNLR